MTLNKNSSVSSITNGATKPRTNDFLVRRKNSDEVSVEDHEFGETDEKIIHAASS